MLFVSNTQRFGAGVDDVVFVSKLLLRHGCQPQHARCVLKDGLSINIVWHTATSRIFQIQCRFDAFHHNLSGRERWKPIGEDRLRQ